MLSCHAVMLCHAFRQHIDESLFILDVGEEVALLQQYIHVL